MIFFIILKSLFLFLVFSFSQQYLVDNYEDLFIAYFETRTQFCDFKSDQNIEQRLVVFKSISKSLCTFVIILQNSLHVLLYLVAFFYVDVSTITCTIVYILLFQLWDLIFTIELFEEQFWSVLSWSNLYNLFNLLFVYYMNTFSLDLYHLSILLQQMPCAVESLSAHVKSLFPEISYPLWLLQSWLVYLRVVKIIPFIQITMLSSGILIDLFKDFKVAYFDYILYMMYVYEIVNIYFNLIYNGVDTTKSTDTAKNK